jgi:hypothetical protein
MPNSETHHYVTYSGIPLSITLQWPYHPSTSGADFFVLHGQANVEDGSGTYSPFAIHMSQTVREALPSLEPKDALPATINAVRKTVDIKDIEFLKSNKRQPVPLSSRMYSIVQRKFTFQQANDEQMAEFLKRKLYWAAKLGHPALPIHDPVESLYLGSSTEKVADAARLLTTHGYASLSGEHFAATEKLMAQAAQFEDMAKKALEELEAKHAFERA